MILSQRVLHYLQTQLIKRCEYNKLSSSIHMYDRWVQSFICHHYLSQVPILDIVHHRYISLSFMSRHSHNPLILMI